MTLPSDVISEILSHDPQLILSGRQLSREISTKLGPSYIREICRKKITATEFDQYISKFPRTIVIIYHQKYSEPAFPPMLTAEIYNYNIGYNKIMLMTEYTVPMFELFGGAYFIVEYDDVMPNLKNIYPTNPAFSIHRNYPDIIMPGGELDLLSTYKILQTRLGCLRINPHFAKEVVIQRFNQIVNEYLNHPSQTRILDLYLYLLAHTWVFDIEGYPNIMYGININYKNRPMHGYQPIYNKDYIDQPINTEKNMKTLKEIRTKVDQLIIKIKYHLMNLD